MTLSTAAFTLTLVPVLVPVVLFVPVKFIRVEHSHSLIIQSP